MGASKTVPLEQCMHTTQDMKERKQLFTNVDLLICYKLDPLKCLSRSKCQRNTQLREVPYVRGRSSLGSQHFKEHGSKTNTTSGSTASQRRVRYILFGERIHKV